MKTKIELDEHDMKQALAHWIAAGCPKVDDVSGVTIGHCAKIGNDPRDYSYSYASVTTKESDHGEA